MSVQTHFIQSMSVVKTLKEFRKEVRSSTWQKGSYHYIDMSGLRWIISGEEHVVYHPNQWSHVQLLLYDQFGIQSPPLFLSSGVEWWPDKFSAGHHDVKVEKIFDLSDLKCHHFIILSYYKCVVWNFVIPSIWFIELRHKCVLWGHSNLWPSESSLFIFESKPA